MSGKVGDLTRLIGLISAQGDSNTARSVSDRDAGLNLQQGGLQQLVFPTLAQIGPSGQVNEFTYSSNGTFLYLAKSGTSPGAEFQVSFVGEKSLTSITPGTKIVGNFKGFRLVNTGVIVGTARFVIGQTPGVGYEEWDLESYGSTPSSGPASFWTVLEGTLPFAAPPSGIPGTPANPIAVPLKGARAFRAIILTNSGDILTGAVRWWLYDLQLALWMPTPIVDTLVVGYPRAVTADHEVGVRYGYAWPELYSNTNNSAPSTWSVLPQVL